MKNVLVIGATGFLGSQLVRTLNENDISVSVYRRAPSSVRRLRGCKFKEFLGELTDSGELKKALQQCDTVFYLAACISLLSRDHRNCQLVNVEHFEAALRVIQDQPNVRLVYCSSVAALGLTKHPKVLSELDSGDLYGISYFESKKEAEMLVVQAVKKGLDAVIVNPATIVGPDMRESQQRTFRNLAQGKVTVCPPGGTSICDVRDVCVGMIQAAHKGVKGERYILAGHNLSYREYFKIISRIHKKTCQLISLPSFLFPVLGAISECLGSPYGRDAGIVAANYGFFSSKKAEKYLGYQISPIEEIIKRISLTGENDAVN